MRRPSPSLLSHVTLSLHLLVVIILIIIAVEIVTDTTGVYAKRLAQTEKPTFVLAFIPVNWSGGLDEFDEIAQIQTDHFIATSGIDYYANIEMKLIHEILFDDLNNEQLHTAVARHGAKQTPADIYIGLTDGDLLSDSTTGWTIWGGNGVIAEADASFTAVHELGHIFGLCDEYNYAIWERQNTTLNEVGGCPNPYPADCEQCELDEGACCQGVLVADGAYCVMGPASPNNTLFSEACLTGLQKAFIDLFGLPPTPITLPRTATPVVPSHPTPVPPSPTSTPTPSPFEFSALVEQHGRSHLMLVDSGGEQNVFDIPDVGNIYGVAWHPNGKQAVLSVGNDHNLDLYLWQRNGGKPTRLTETPFSESQPTWHPYEEKIIGVVTQAGHSDLYEFDLRTNHKTRLTESVGNERGPTISPDGHFVTYSYELDGSSTLALLELETGLTTYPDLDVQVVHPAWSRDGQRIAIAAAYEDNWDIALWHRTTDRLERLTYGGGQHLAPVWLSDSRLLFQTNKQQLWMIYVMNDDGTNQQQLLQIDNNVRMPAVIPH